MIAHSILKTTAFRLAIIYIALFVIVYLGANVAAYQMVVRFLDGRLNASVTERYREIYSAFENRGLGGAVQMIESHGPAVRGQETIYTLRGPSNELIAGNAELSEVPIGFSTLQPADQHESSSHYKLFRGQMGKFDLIVGINSGDTDQFSRIVLVSFGWATVMILTVGMMGAAFLAYRTRRRISALSRAAHAIGHGQLFRRLPVSSRMDDIDLLSSEVNVAIARLESSVIALKQVTTDVAHDLKTPIARTFLVLEDALQLDRASVMRVGIETALVELKSISDTFDALLRIAQIEAKSRLANFRVLDLRLLVSDLHEIYEAIAIEEGYELVLGNSDLAVWINGDPELIRQLIANLLANSMRHTPAGSKIELGLSRKRHSFCLSVSDDGPGIPSGERSRVFDRFYRLEKSRTTAGSGLGLSLVKAIAELHNAKIKLLDNEPGLQVVIEFPEAENGNL